MLHWSTVTVCIGVQSQYRLSAEASTAPRSAAQSAQSVTIKNAHTKNERIKYITRISRAYGGDGRKDRSMLVNESDCCLELEESGDVQENVLLST